MGTIDSLWGSQHGEVLATPGIDIFDKTWKICRNPVLPAQKITPAPSCPGLSGHRGLQIYGTVKHSVLSEASCWNSDVEDAVLMDGVVVKAGAVVKRCILAEDVVVGAGARSATAPSRMWAPSTVGAGATKRRAQSV